MLTLLDGDVALVEGRDEGGLGQRVLEREELVARHGGGARLQHGLAADRRQVAAAYVPVREEDEKKKTLYHECKLGAQRVSQSPRLFGVCAFIRCFFVCV